MPEVIPFTVVPLTLHTAGVMLVKVAPLFVQMFGVPLLYVTVRPELAVAATVN